MENLEIDSNVNATESFSVGCWNVGGADYDC